ncbi:MAG: hypothetical protein JXA83_07040 [Acidimicrobiales bacterium]|nr:hypothetical protein [Acidimicrobiales bacterium]
MSLRFRAVLGAAVIAALSVSVTAPAGAQGAPTLGLTIEPTEGSPGDTVAGQVDVADVAESCATTAEDIQPSFAALRDTLLAMQPDYTPAPDAEFTSAENFAWELLAVVSAAVAMNYEGAADATLPETYVMTFADIATQAPVGERATFDPSVGAAEVTVPDVAPGLWAVAAACVVPASDTESIEAAINQGADYLTDVFDLPDPLPVSWGVPGDFDLVGFLLAEGGPTLLAPLMVPDALGVQVFCVLDAAGACPADPADPGDPGDPADPADPADPVDPATPPASVAPPATPVRATPTFTG